MGRGVEQTGIKTEFAAGRRAAIIRTSRPIVNTLIREGEIVLGAAVVIGGLAVHAKDNISRRKTLRYGVGGTLVALVLGDCGSGSNDNNNNGKCPSGWHETVDQHAGIICVSN